VLLQAGEYNLRAEYEEPPSDFATYLSDADCVASTMRSLKVLPAQAAALDAQLEATDVRLDNGQHASMKLVLTAVDAFDNSVPAVPHRYWRVRRRGSAECPIAFL
jgi:hypothetical protein